MKPILPQRLVYLGLALLFSVGLWIFSPAAQAYDAPELLPDQPTDVIDLADTFTYVQRKNLDSHLDQFEQETGWKLRVLTQFDRTPGRALKDLLED